MTTATADKPKARVKKSAPRNEHDVNNALDAVAAELEVLAFTDIYAPENAPRAGHIIARMLLLDFVAYSLSRQISKYKLRPDIGNATKRAALFFVDNPTHPTIETYHWGTRIFSEFHNCRQLVNSEAVARTETLQVFLETMESLPSNSLNFEYINDSVFSAACMLKAYNVLMDVMAELYNTPELLMAKADYDLLKLIGVCKGYNKHANGAHINIGHLQERPPATEKNRIIHGIGNSNATLQSLMFTVYVSLRYNSEAGQKYDEYC